MKKRAAVFALPLVIALVLPSCVSAATAKLAWDASPSPGVASYNVYRSTSQGSGYVKVGSTAGLSYTDSTVPNTGQRFYYVVTAVNSGGEESEYSNEVFFVERPLAPPNVRVVP